MKLAIMQPYIFPYVGYYQLMCACDRVVFLDDVNFIKKGFINRNNILLNGQKKRFTIPVKSASQNTLIKDIHFFEFKKNQELFLKQIKHAYIKAPYFNSTYNLITEIFKHTQDNSTVSYTAINTITTVLRYLDITLEYYCSSNLPKTHLKKDERIIDICKYFNTTTYINPIGGIALYDKNKFKKAGINLFFLKSSLQEYSQNQPLFVNALSIIDVLMFNDKNTIKDFLKSYTLI